MARCLARPKNTHRSRRNDAASMRGAIVRTQRRSRMPGRARKQVAKSCLRLPRPNRRRWRQRQRTPSPRNMWSASTADGEAPTDSGANPRATLLSQLGRNAAATRARPLSTRWLPRHGTARGSAGTLPSGVAPESPALASTPDPWLAGAGAPAPTRGRPADKETLRAWGCEVVLWFVPPAVARLARQRGGQQTRWA